MLTIKNLRVFTENKEIIKGIDLDAKPGEVVAIMGPNGSGKTTLAYALTGHPNYQITNDKFLISKIELNGDDLTDLEPHERSLKGLFMVNQYPVAIPGLTTQSYLWQLYKKHNVGVKTSLLEFRKWITQQAEKLGLDPELLRRGLNDGFSGGEKKKVEVLQMLVSNPKYVVLDEVDSGLDIDALRKIAQTVAKMAKDLKVGILLITHHRDIFAYLKPSVVHVIRDGVISRTGDMSLVDEIESTGYEGNQ